MKKAFSLFEILITLILISIVYYFALSNINIGQKQIKQNITLDNLKEKLLEFKFENNIQAVCVDDKLQCFIIIDDNYESYKSIEQLFDAIPKVYKYSKELRQIDYSRIDLKDIPSMNVIFKFKINRYNKSQDLIVETNKDGVYIFNSIHNKPIKVGYINDVYNYFEEKQKSLKDAL